MASDELRIEMPQNQTLCRGRVRRGRSASQRSGASCAHGLAILSFAFALCPLESLAQDFDADGIPDASDNCPFAANPDQADNGRFAGFEPDGRGDACECSDVNGDGSGQLNDLTILRRALVGLGPGLAHPEKCNVVGPVDPGDDDGDGVPNDCQLDDVVALTRALIGLDSPRANVCVAAAGFGVGLVIGEVYDDSRGLPLAGAIIDLVDASGNPPENPITATSDSRGRFTLALDSGEVVFQITKPGFTYARRDAQVLPGEAIKLFDARLTPVQVTSVVNPAVGSQIGEEEEATLEIPPGALATQTTVELTALSSQALPSPLPLGWSPVGAAHLAPNGLATNAPLVLSFVGASAGGAIAVRWDDVAGVWIRIARDGEAGPVLVDQLGSVALVVPDRQPAMPVIPQVGEPLSAVVPVPIPPDATLAIEPRPRVLFLEAEARSEISSLLQSPSAVPSGTRIEVRFQEHYARTDGRQASPEASTQDLLLYQRTGGIEARFPASPSLSFDPALLQEGTITLEAKRVRIEEAFVIDAAGGRFVTSDGVDVTLSAGALGRPEAVAASTVVSLDPGLEGIEGFTFLVGFELQVGPTPLDAPATVALSSAPLDPDLQALVVQPVEVDGTTEYELVALASTATGGIVIDPAGGQLPLPGIRDSGRYFVVVLNEPVGFVTGSVLTSEGALDQGVVKVMGLPFASLADGEDPSFALVAPLGDAEISGRDVGTGFEALAAIAIAQVAEIVSRDIDLIRQGPLVIATSPEAESITSQLAGPITVTFSRPVQASTLAGGAIQIGLPGGALPGELTLDAARRIAAFLPDKLLPDATYFEIRVAPSILDDFGNALVGGNQPDGSFLAFFGTADLTPPPPPDVGVFTIDYVDTQTLHLESGPGTTEPGVSVTAVNLVTGVSTTVVAESDGSFAMDLAAAPGQAIELVIADAAGNTTSVAVSPPVVPIAVVVQPSEVLFLENGATRPLAVEVLLSDGSLRPANAGEIVGSTSNPLVAEIDSTNVLQATGAGTTQVSIGLANDGIATDAIVDVEVRSDTTLVVEGQVDASGGVLAGPGIQIDIPAGAIAGPETIRVEQIDATGLTIPGATLPGDIRAVYRITPDLEFALPISITIDVPGGIVAEDGSDLEFAIGRAVDPALGDLRVDQVAGSSLEHANQYLDRELERIVSSTQHFSYRVLISFNDIGGEDYRLVRLDDVVAARNPLTVTAAQTLLPLQVPVKRLPGAQPLAPKTNANPFRHVIWHATNPGVAPVRLALVGTEVCNRSVSAFLPNGSFYPESGTDVRARTLLPSAPNAANQCQVAANVKIWGSSFAVQMAFCTTTSCPDPETTPQRYVADLEDLARLIIEREVISVPTPMGTLTLDARPANAVRGRLRSVPISNGAADADGTAQFYVRPDGEIFMLYPPIHRAPHAEEANPVSTGVEIQHTGVGVELFGGPQLSSVLRLSDYLLGLRSDSEMASPRGRRRQEGVLQTDYEPFPRGFAAPNSFTVTQTINDFEAILSHGEQDNRLGTDDMDLDEGPSCGFDIRRAEPCKPFPLDAMVSALDYDFPGAIDLRGGDARQVVDGCNVRFGRCTGRGGHALLAYLGRSPREPIDANELGVPSALREEIELDRFFGLPGSAFAVEPLENVEIASGAVLSCGELVTESGQPPGTPEAKVGNLLIKGILDIRDVPLCRIRVSGMMYLAPGGEIIGRGVDSGNGSSLTVISAGPVVLHGLIDLSGGNVKTAGIAANVPGGAGDGGDLTVVSRADAPLQVPTVVTHGGDAGIVAEETGSTDVVPDQAIIDGLMIAGKGGPGGNVTLIGANESLVVLSGMKAIPRGPFPCDYEELSQPVINGGVVVQPRELGVCRALSSTTGLRPLLCRSDSECGAPGCDRRPGLMTVANDMPLERDEESSFFDPRTADSLAADADPGDRCTAPMIPDFHGNHGLSRSQGRGIITSGGKGGSGRRSTDSVVNRLRGADGGEGGAIRIGFSGPGGRGTVLFRGVSLITGPGAGLMKERIPVAVEFGENAPILPFTTASGGAGGTGTTRPTGFSVDLPGGFVIANNGPIGGDGGSGGRAGEIWVSPSADIRPRMDRICEEQNIYGHDSRLLDESLDTEVDPLGRLKGQNPQIPKDVPVQVIGLRVGLCEGSGFGSTPAGETGLPALSLVLSTRPGSDSERNDFSRAQVDCPIAVDPGSTGATRVCLAGGSGGLAGGGLGHLVSFTGIPGIESNTESAFDRKGTAGEFGFQGAGSNLTLPNTLWQVLESLTRLWRS